jgi:signal transduction histidine kinase
LHYLIHHHRPDGTFYPLEECPIGRALPQNIEIRAHEDVFIHKDGTFLPVSCAASPVFENGLPVATVIEVRDVTQEKQAQSRLVQVNNELSQKNQELERINKDLSRVNADLDNFVYMASHDLRAPICNMEGLLELLRTQLEDRLEADDQVLLRHLLISLQKLNRTINDLSDIVKVSKDTDQDPELVDMDQLLKEIKEDISPLLTSSDAQMVTQWEISSLQYPRKHLRSILYNLLSNAVKYRHPDRICRVTIRTQRLERGVSLSVADNGLGLEPDQVGKLFKMFGRLHPHIEGTGIGLYTIKRMVENYGGSISVVSTPLEGTTFTVFFSQLS